MKDEFGRRISPLFAPMQPVTERERPVCRRSARCRDCPYPRHGIVCWHRDGTCLRTDMEEIQEREGKRT